ncbi:hypothetical protein DL766_008674 [Monosporascus sp. MC13-8B]|nr:hypothetical protein DL763_009878 [Monosporascus cannonballus]RYP18403.1 hypothetical protein DL766_008674 [Monosporascus sp. MC13-8B]
MRTRREAELLHLGKDYPQGFSYFRPRLHRAFMANAHLQDEGDVRRGIARAEFVKKVEKLTRVLLIKRSKRCKYTAETEP